MGDESDVVYVFMDETREGAVDPESLNQVIRMATAQQQHAESENQEQMVYVLEKVDGGGDSIDTEHSQFTVQEQLKKETRPESESRSSSQTDFKVVGEIQEDSGTDQKSSTKKDRSHSRSSIAVQANDFEIERRSGVVPTRRRIIPAKFRDYQNALSEEDGSDEDYNPELDNVHADRKMRKTVLGNKTGKKPGRPKKMRADHSYDKGDEVIEMQSFEKPTEEQNVQMNETSSSTTGAYTPRRGRPPKDLIAFAGSKNFKCLTCDKRFSQKGNLKAHMRIHTDERPFICDIVNCKKNFRTNESLKRHKMAHMGIKLFECEICKQKFSSNVALTEHTARHTDSKPYKCEECGRMFRQISCFKRHQTIHKSETPFECEICSKRFSQMIYLKSHMRSHTGERPHKCVLCDKAFAHQSDLNRHRVTHAGTKPYICDVCGARFSDPSSRRRHVKEHSGFKPYTCQLCTETFKRAGQLKAHLNKKHMDFKDDVIITRTGPHQTMEFQFKNDSAAGVDQRVLEAQREFVKKVTQGATAQQKHQFVIQDAGDGSGQTIHLEDAQVLSTDGGAFEQLVVATQSGEYQQITEETQRIIEQIQSQLDSQAASQPDGQPLQVAYQIIHDDDNQQVLEIQYHQVMEVEDPTAAEAQPVEESDQPDPEGTYEQQQQQQQVDEVSDSHQEESEGPATQPLTSQDGVVAVEPAEEIGVTQETRTTTIEQAQPESNEVSDNSTETETSPTSTLDSETSTGVDYVAHPDFNSQAYYNWLTNFTELCKLVPVPLEVDLFQKISQVFKSLSDVLATPSGILANKDNFKILMNISKDLNSIINEHLGFVLKNLDEQEQ